MSRPRVPQARISCLRRRGFGRQAETRPDSSIRGRLVVFFPGEYENGNYRFLDARDGWSYRAVPILASEGAFAS